MNRRGRNQVNQDFRIAEVALFLPTSIRKYPIRGQVHFQRA